MNVRQGHVTALALAAVGAAVVWMLGGPDVGVGGVAAAAAVAARVGWVLVVQPLLAARRGTSPADDPTAAPFAYDHCITVFFVMALVHLVLRWVVRDAPAADGALDTTMLAGLSLLAVYAGSRWLRRRRADVVARP